MAPARPSRPETAKAIVAGTCLAVVKSINHETTLARYREILGDQQGEIELSNQFARIFEDARASASVQVDTFARNVPGVGYFTTSTAEQAEALAAAMIRVAENHNALVPDVGLHKNIGAVIVAADASSQSPEQWARDTRSGEVRLSEAAYKALPADRRRCYEPVTDLGDHPASRGAAVVWRRQVIARPALLPNITRAVMVVDMARFSRIQKNMKLMYKGSPAMLDTQIVEIIAAGFRNAGASSYEQYMNNWGGDGGSFFFDNPNLAHRIAVEILKQAEELHNKEARESNCEDAMRCFRIGIDFGRLDRVPDSGEYAGEPITRAQRLESGGPTGEIRISEEFYRRLGEDLRRAYGDKEPIFGKSHDHEKGISGRRLAVAERAMWPEVGRDNKPFAPIKQPNSDFPQAPETAAAIETCFVICPLGEGQARVADVFERLIVPACAKAAFSARRATDIPGDRKSVIAENLWNAPLVIAYLGDPANWNHNVILEVGIRLATGLPLVMLSDGIDGGRDPDYQRLLPFQIVHHNIITVPTDPAQMLQRVLDEIGNSRARASQSWESPSPVLEFRYTTFDDVLITDANETARTVFGADNVRKGQGIERLRKFLAETTDPVQADARRDEQIAILDAFLARAVRGRGAAKNWRPPKARIPIVFQNPEIDPESKKPVGYLPIVVRYQFEQQCTRVRYLYLRVAASMQKPEHLPYYVCDI